MTHIDDDDHDDDERAHDREEQSIDDQGDDERVDEDEAGEEQASDEDKPDEDVPDEPRLQKPRRNSFRKAGPKLTPDAAARQGEVTTLAFKVLGRDQAIAFLNGHNDELSSRPIDLAVESAEGAARVTSVIEASRKG